MVRLQVEREPDMNKIDRAVQQAFSVGLKNLGNGVGKYSMVLAPRLSGDLVRSLRVHTNDSSVEVSYNTPYATRRHYENRKNPGTKRYLERGLTAAAKNLDDYFKVDI